MDRAFDDLARLDVGGVQLTPGNMPTPDFEAHARASGLATRTRHGFTFQAFKTTVWNDDGTCNVTSDSVHPPVAASSAVARFLDAPALPILETMYPGWALGDGAAIELAMARGLSLAVDVSHLHIQREHGLVGDATLARIFDYDRIVEVHVSANDGRPDASAGPRARGRPRCIAGHEARLIPSWARAVRRTRLNRARVVIMVRTCVRPGCITITADRCSETSGRHRRAARGIAGSVPSGFSRRRD